jgi:DedD protein
MLKQRLIGAAVVVALAVVLVPMVLNTVGKHNVREIPAAPDYVSNSSPDKANLVHRKVPTPGRQLTHDPASNISPADYAYSGQYNRDDNGPDKSAKKKQAKVDKKTDKKKTRSASSEYIVERRTVKKRMAKPAPQTTTYIAKNINTHSLNTRAIQKTAAVRKPAKRRPSVWSVQIASFSRQDNARVLKTKLARAGFKAYITRKKSNARKQVYRVRVGPATNKSKAKAILVRIKREVRLNGYITSHR